MLLRVSLVNETLQPADLEIATRKKFAVFESYRKLVTAQKIVVMGNRLDWWWELAELTVRG